MLITLLSQAIPGTIAKLLQTSSESMEMTSNYIRGIGLGATFTILIASLIPYLQLNHSGNVCTVVVIKAFEYAAEQNGADVVILDAQNDVAQSVSCMENLIQQGVDGISIFPISGEQGAQLVQMANEAGIPITVENLDMSQYADPESYVASVGCVYGDIGDAAINWLANNVDDAKVFYAAGAAGGGVFEAYKEGVDKALADNAGKIEMVGLQNGQDWSTENGLDMTQNFINSGKEFNCIFANNDQIAQGCHQALEAAGLDYPVVSTGGSPDAYKFLEDKIEAANMTAPVSIQGVQTFLNIYDYVKNGKTPDAKFQSLPVIPVSADKLDEWIDWSDFAGAYDYCTK